MLNCLGSKRSNCKSRRSLGLTMLAFALPLAIAGSGRVQAGEGDARTPWTGPVPKAHCGIHDRTEKALQGQLTLADRESGASLKAYNCNLELVGSFAGEGAEWQMAWFGDCAYFDTKNMPTQLHQGVPVLDVSNPKHPYAVTYLVDPSMDEPWESLKVNDRRRLLGGIQANNGNGLQAGFSLYDISRDCRTPHRLASVTLPVAVAGHAGDFAPDGRTYYGTQISRSTYAIDIANPTDPKLITNWAPADRVGVPHDITISEDGNRMYVAQPGGGLLRNNNGLVIVDVSDIQNRVPNPQPKVVSTLFWNDGGIAQVGKPIRINGKPFILFSDEMSANGLGASGAAASCAAGLPPFGFARLIDISDEKNPVVTAKLMLQVHDPKNCSAVLTDSTDPVFIYDSHYCTVDDPHNARLALCSYFQAGIRIFDIRDPYRPREVAYYKPGGVGAASRPGSALASFVPPPHAYDWSSSNIRFVTKDGEAQVWFTSHDNGFQVLRFTDLDDITHGNGDDHDHTKYND
jgi:hypothetical protein